MGLVLLLSMTAGACSIEVGDVRVGPAPICDTTSRGLLILMAQAVPTAELIPCVESLPPGWAVEWAEIETDSAELSFDGGNVGDVTVELEATCDPAGDAIDVEPGLDLVAFELVDDELTRYYVFTGGCVTVVAPDRPASSELTSELGFLTRKDLSDVSSLEL